MKRLRFWVPFLCTVLLQLFIVGTHSGWQRSIAAAPEALLPTMTGEDASADPHFSNFVLPHKLEGAIASADLEDFDTLTEDTEKLDGLFTLYRSAESGKTYLEILPEQLNRNFLSIVTLEGGIGEWGLIQGIPVNDFLFQLRRVQDQVQFVVPNIFFASDQDDPQRRSLDSAFSDSTLYSLPILSIHPDRQSLLIDLDGLLLGERDLANLASRFWWLLGSNYVQDPETSYLGEIKAFPLNVEIETHYGFAGAPSSFGSGLYLDTLPDSRAFTLRVRYSFSQLPEANGFQPRPADERVGYFVSAFQDLSRRNARDPFVRYIYRWHLEPEDPAAVRSHPREPIVFWIENTVPLEYRDAIRDGILMWNAAFEDAGFEEAIVVRQMPDDADWDPADVRYNVVRWISNYEGGWLGMGPSRVNPLTGQILDTDILLNANVVRLVETSYGLLAENNLSALWESNVPLCSNQLRPLYLRWLATQSAIPQQDSDPTRSRAIAQLFHHQDLCFGSEASHHLNAGALSLSLMDNVLPSGEELKDYLNQFLKHLVAHEIGHTLGLRHNFRGSTMLSPAELNDPELTQRNGLSGSVMDYLPVNLAAQEQSQGEYFPTIVGPYDHWAIAFGYQQLPDDPRLARQQLNQLAQRGDAPELAYATDEDAWDVFDPAANVWDLSSDPLAYAQTQMQNARQMLERLEQRYPLPGESYSELRDRFNIVFYHYFSQAPTMTRMIGGRIFNRDRRDDPGARLPFEPVPLAEQRRALALLNDTVFANQFQFSPTLLNQLAPHRWMHWGSFPSIYSLEYPLYDRILFWQTLTLSDLLSSDRLSRLRDAELRSPTSETLTLPELFDTLQTSVWSEVVQDDDQLAIISSLRRGLQRQYLNLLINLALRNNRAIEEATNFVDFIVAIQTYNAPEDARVLARYELDRLRDAIRRTLRRHDDDLDTLTLAHLQEASDRIQKALDAPLQSG